MPRGIIPPEFSINICVCLSWGVCCDFHESVHVNTKILLQVKTRKLPFVSFPIHYCHLRVWRHIICDTERVTHSTNKRWYLHKISHFKFTQGRKYTYQCNIRLLSCKYWSKWKSSIV